MNCIVLKEVYIMAVPKRKTSKKVKNQRRAHQNLTVPGLIECSNCGEVTRSYNVCRASENYDDKDAVEYISTATVMYSTGERSLSVVCSFIKKRREKAIYHNLCD